MPDVEPSGARAQGVRGVHQLGCRVGPAARRALAPWGIGAMTPAFLTGRHTLDVAFVAVRGEAGVGPPTSSAWRRSACRERLGDPGLAELPDDVFDAVFGVA